MNLYSSDPVILYFITALMASYGGHYIIVLVKQDYLQMKSSNSLFEKLLGFMERILVISTFFIGMPQPVLIPLIFIIRPYLYKVSKSTLNLSSQFSSYREILFSGALSIAMGLVFYMLI